MERLRHIVHQTPQPSLHAHRLHRHCHLTPPNAAAPSVPPYSSSEDSEDSNTSTDKNTVQVDLIDLAAAEESIAKQQAAGLPPPYDLAATKVKYLYLLLNTLNS
jgi:hypothetical protein